ncbi:hypothetical protein [Actinoplanes couchii]|uniref:Uncharacterized protein n=1 Tax=Actinoplanes couchii TaxID=403638 RepID=A0ABQ3XF05_9ACTN|nr:hypothetical protein [Actinoplanes couchii]MDR6319924.1 hypothetical protein [Actinoplanes couchii]GID57061.1 hypothetical protein Aco03nite_054650 [Actinoplanes couchii]
MSDLRRPQRILLGTGLTAATTSGLGVAINLATEPHSSWPIWVVVVLLTVASALLMAWLTAPGRNGTAREFDARDVSLTGEAEVRPRKGAAVRTRNFTAGDQARFIVTDSSDPGQMKGEEVGEDDR